MKVSGGLEEQGTVVGNAYDKYGSKNPIVRRIMRGFENALSELVRKSNPSTIHEVGCGEGFWTLSWREAGIEARGSDFSRQVIDLARENATERELPKDIFKVCSIYELQSGRDNADLIVCCEVLEHLEKPEEALSVLKTIVDQELIVSVPREPIWCALNLLRGKYLTSLGNTPGHLQHWSSSAFVRMIEQHFELLDVRRPLPWTMIRCRARD